MAKGKILLLALFAVCLSSASKAQYYYFSDGYYDNDFVFELGGGFGMMNSICDVGGANSDTKMYINEMRGGSYRSSGGFYVGMMYQNFIGARLEATWGTIKGADDQITSTASLNLITKRNRNLSYKTKINEIMVLAEFHPLMLKYYEDGAPRLSPYAVAGVGYFSFNPQAQIGGNWIDLQPLRTEGQGFAEYPDRTPYKLSGVNIPMGLGLRYELSPLCNVRLEFIHRVLFTDYLDDASGRGYPNPDLFKKYLSLKDAAYAKAASNPSLNGKTPARRGNPDDNDVYMSINLKIGIVLGRQARY